MCIRDSEECDGGPILLQKAVDILPGDTPEVLQKRVCLLYTSRCV